jgi:hypothetical protein
MDLNVMYGINNNSGGNNYDADSFLIKQCCLLLISNWAWWSCFSHILTALNIFNSKLIWNNFFVTQLKTINVQTKILQSSQFPSAIRGEINCSGAHIVVRTQSLQTSNISLHQRQANFSEHRLTTKQTHFLQSLILMLWFPKWTLIDLY